MPGAKLWRGPRTFQRFEEYSMEITSKPWTGGEIEFDRLMDIGRNATKIQSSMTDSIRVVSRIPNQQVVNAIVDGETTDAYDGEKFFLSSTAERGYANMVSQTGTDEAALKSGIDKIEVALGQVVSNTGRELQLSSRTIICPTALFNTFRTITESTASTVDNKNANVINLYNGWRAVNVPQLKGNSWYVLVNGEESYPVIWQTTTIKGQSIILDVIDAFVGIHGTIMYAASMYGAAKLAHPFALFKVKTP